MTKLGYLVPTREQIMQEAHGTGELIERAQFAQKQGFDSLWVGDSLFARPRHDPLTLLAALAVATPGMEIGTAILLQSLRNPVILAQQLATIDQLSQGKLIVGVGIGADAPSIRAEFAAAGVPFDKRVGRLVESVNLCRALWRGEPVTWDGRWQVDNVVVAPKPFQDGGPKIWYASGVDTGVERAGKHFDGWFPIGPDAETISRQQKILDVSAADAGRQSETAVYLTVCVDGNVASANEKIDEYLEQYYGFSAEILRGIQACFGGDAASVIDWMNTFVEAGANHLVLRVVGDYREALSALADHRQALK